MASGASGAGSVGGRSPAASGASADSGCSLALGWATELMLAWPGAHRDGTRWLGKTREVPLLGWGCVPSTLTFTDRQQKPFTLLRSPTACSRVTPSSAALKEGPVAS